MNKIYMLIVVFLSSALCQEHESELKNRLRDEVLEHTNRNITKETHPLLYSIIEETVMCAGVAMPRYVSIYTAEYNTVSKNGNVYRRVNDILAYVDALGDLYICREILTTLTIEEIRAIIAIAVAEKATKRAEKAVLTAAGTLGVTVATLFAANAYYDLKLGRIVQGLLTSDSLDLEQRTNNLEVLISVIMMPSFASAALVYAYLQKNVDKAASNIAGIPAVVHAIASLEKLQDSYRKENIFSRLADYLKLKPIMNTLLYPIRASTPQERIAYLQSL